MIHTLWFNAVGRRPEHWSSSSCQGTPPKYDHGWIFVLKIDISNDLWVPEKMSVLFSFIHSILSYFENIPPCLISQFTSQLTPQSYLWQEPIGDLDRDVDVVRWRWLTTSTATEVTRVLYWDNFSNGLTPKIFYLQYFLISPYPHPYYLEVRNLTGNFFLLWS